MTKKQTTGVFSRIGFAFVIFIVVHQVVVILADSIIAGIAPQLAQSGLYLWLLSYIPLYLVAFPIMLLMLRTVPNSTPAPPLQAAVSAKHMLMLVAAALGITIALNYVSTALLYLVAALRGTEIAENPLAAMSGQSSVWLNFIIVGIVAPVMEEIVFRRILYKKLIQFGGGVFCVVSAVMFALFHMNLYQLLYAFVLGLILAYLTCLTGTIKYSIILHLSLNILGNAGSTILYTYLPHTAYLAYNILLSALAVAGIVFIAVWFIRWRKNVQLPPAQVPLEKNSQAVLNLGMGLYILLTGAVVLASSLIA